MAEGVGQDKVQKLRGAADGAGWLATPPPSSSGPERRALRHNRTTITCGYLKLTRSKNNLTGMECTRNKRGHYDNPVEPPVESMWNPCIWDTFRSQSHAGKVRSDNFSWWGV
ncbi:hypothetical protein E2C01_071539 [Portunus trituberculatus]|uniref:Uncharacterized protein n=1 Tax=Portunus trituberculatus TaxID=210409 RepID=A0A5B7I4P7_PORTR|nr:hypothetical protein [Portunus trituberculatus]